MLDQTNDGHSTSLQLLFDNTTSKTCCSEVTTPEFFTEEETRTLAERVVWSFIIIMIIMASIIGNLLVIVCIRLHHSLREENANIFIVNLSVTDMTSAAIVMVSSLHAMASDKWHIGEIMCDIVCGANYTLIVVSMLTLCFISLDRYMAVVHALHYHVRVTKRRVYMMVGYAWIQGLCFGLVPVLARWIKYDYWEVVCAIVWRIDQDYLIAFVIVGFNICFVIPSIILVVSYCKVMRVASTQNKTQPQVGKVKATAPLQINMRAKEITNTSINQNNLNTQNFNSSFDNNNDNDSSNTRSATNTSTLASCQIENKPFVLAVISKENSLHKDLNSQLPNVTILPSDDNLPGVLQEVHKQESRASFSKAINGHEHQKAVKGCRKIHFTPSLPEDEAHNLIRANVSNASNPTTEFISSKLLADESSRNIDNNVQISSHCKDISNHPCSTSDSIVALSSSSQSQIPYPQDVSRKSSEITQASNLTAQLFKTGGTENDGVINSSNFPSTNSCNVVTSAREQDSFNQGFANPRTVAQTSSNIIRSTSTTTKRNYSVSNRAVKSLLIVIVAYFICMTPFCTTKLYKVVVPHKNLPGYINLLSSIFQFCSSAINPLIYGIFRKDFKRAFLLLAKRVLVRFKILEKNTNDFNSATY